MIDRRGNSETRHFASSARLPRSESRVLREILGARRSPKTCTVRYHQLDKIPEIITITHVSYRIGEVQNNLNPAKAKPKEDECVQAPDDMISYML